MSKDTALKLKLKEVVACNPCTRVYQSQLTKTLLYLHMVLVLTDSNLAKRTGFKIRKANPVLKNMQC